MNFKRTLPALGVGILLAGTLTSATELTRLDKALTGIEKFATEEPAPEPEPPVVAEEIKEEPKRPWTSTTLSKNELDALNYFQDHGIVDKVALATLLGNIQQESRFTPNICEGGAKIKYEYCKRGGYGLIQWTTSFRYWGLGNFAKLNSCDEEDLKCQLGYLITEREWKEALWRFKTPNKSISFYMKGAYRWLGWGIYGNRGYYSQQYVKALTPNPISGS